MITLLNEDCMNVRIPKCRLLLTDIPYGVVSRSDNGLRNLDKSNADIETFDLLKFLNHIYDSFDICCIFWGREQISTISDFFEHRQGTTRQIVWLKPNPSPMNGEYVYLSGIENAIWFKKRGTGKLNCKCKKNYFIYPCGRSKLHPTEKPVNLLREIILDCTSPDDWVVDTCMGSGSTGVACKETGRNFFGIELNEEYYNVCIKRLYDK